MRVCGNLQQLESSKRFIYLAPTSHPSQVSQHGDINNGYLGIMTRSPPSCQVRITECMRKSYKGICSGNFTQAMNYGTGLHHRSDVAETTCQSHDDSRKRGAGTIAFTIFLVSALIFFSPATITAIDEL